ncbi:MAG: septum formation initiator family protein [Patescibacteria group bacterium]|nr:septum formation initiator family protein [Patescibacteria group bacterium]
MNKVAQNWKKSPKNSSSIWIKFFFAICLVSFAVVMYALYKETYKKRQIQEEVQKLKDQAISLEQGNQKLKGLIEYFQTQNFSEKEAREKLNVKKEGEEVVILRFQESKEKNTGEKEEGLNEEVVRTISNPLKWWNYFFEERLL